MYTYSGELKEVRKQDLPNLTAYICQGENGPANSFSGCHAFQISGDGYFNTEWLSFINAPTTLYFLHEGFTPVKHTLTTKHDELIPVPPIYMAKLADKLTLAQKNLENSSLQLSVHEQECSPVINRSVSWDKFAFFEKLQPSTCTQPNEVVRFRAVAHFKDQVIHEADFSLTVDNSTAENLRAVRPRD